jgi:hypothetical protein
LEAAGELLDILKSEENSHFRDLITGNEKWFSLDIMPRIVWLFANAELPVPFKRTITDENPCRWYRVSINALSSPPSNLVN